MTNDLHTHARGWVAARQEFLASARVTPAQYQRLAKAEARLADTVREMDEAAAALAANAPEVWR